MPPDSVCGSDERPARCRPVVKVAARLIAFFALACSLATVGPLAVASAVSAHEGRAAPRTALPNVLHLVDKSRRIRLPGGGRIARPVTTYLWYPPPAGAGPWPLVVF